MDLHADDRVVRELDVYLCSSLSAMKAQLVLLQQPLRPRWRPYDLAAAAAAAAAAAKPPPDAKPTGPPASSSRAGVSTSSAVPAGAASAPQPPGIRFKPVAQRLEVDLPLETQGPNHNEDANDVQHTDNITLRSRVLDAGGGTYAVGLLRAGRLLLLPVDVALQLTPYMAHVNAAAAAAAAVTATGSKRGGGGGGESDEEGGGDEEDGPAAPAALEVQVKRRETERQQQARLSSYGYLQQEEEAEAWLPLRLHGWGDGAAAPVWDKLEDAAEAGQAERQMPAPLGRQEYLLGLAPSGTLGSGASGADASSDGGGGAAVAAAAAAAAAAAVDPEVAAAVGVALKALLAKHSLVNVSNVRQWLQEQPSPVREGSGLPSAKLHSLLVEGGNVAFLRGVYVLVRTGNTALDPLRAVVVDLLKDGDGSSKGLKRQDVMSAAARAGLTVTDNVYQRTMKELCNPNGTIWIIKQGADAM